jgi:hypothetical protein
LVPIEEIGEFITVEVDCPGCDGKGFNREKDDRIDPKYLEQHRKLHQYPADKKNPVVCDCPRKITYKKKVCMICNGKLRVNRNYPVPKPGTPIRVTDQKILKELFGNDAPVNLAHVYDIQLPEEHGLELKTGIGVRVSWDRLTRTGGIPKGHEVELWTFDLTELEIAT